MSQLNQISSQLLFDSVFLVATFIAAITDYTKQKIFNILTFPLIILSLVLVFTQHSHQPIAASLTTLGVASLIFIGFYALKSLGAGDVKLLMALSAYLGSNHFREFFSYTLFITGLAAMVLLFRRKRVKIFFSELFLFFRSLVVQPLATHWPRLDRHNTIPLGLAIFLGYGVWYAKMYS